MKFRVDFRGTYFPEAEVGLDGLDQARGETGVPELSAELVQAEIPTRSVYISVYLTEKEARQCGHFSSRNYVKVGGESPSWAIHRKPIVSSNHENGEILCVRWTYEVDENAVVRAWAAAGYPLEWDGEPEG